MKMNKKILAAMAIVLPLTIGTGSALAYFTANTSASAHYPVAVGTDTEIDEEFDAMTKHVSISNAPNSGPVYVRARAFADSQHTLTYSAGTAAEGQAAWIDGGDGYWYYNGVLEPGKSTSKLDVKIDTNEDVTEKENFNVIVVYERTPAVVDPGTGSYKGPKDADWSAALRQETSFPTQGTGSNEGGND